MRAASMRNRTVWLKDSGCMLYCLSVLILCLVSCACTGQDAVKAALGLDGIDLDTSDDEDEGQSPGAEVADLMNLLQSADQMVQALHANYNKDGAPPRPKSKTAGPGKAVE